jgi:excisionase family DNA binding protein
MEKTDTNNNKTEKESCGNKKLGTKKVINILTVNEVAELLRIHRSTVSRYAKSGELKSFKLGSRRLFKYEDILLFFENQVDREYVFGKEL